ncbi:response regulator [Paenibacillus sp. GCM10027626]|uniref:response regulator transcription factor n=1 Tax=Paenibacillus sp. GCM10027626 TaxID=3273411 RepID=UPI003636FB44
MYKVILVDDEKWIVKSLKNTIDWSAHGFEVVDEAFNGVEGYEKIKTWVPDLVFTDIRMPGLDGLELVKRTNEWNRNISFVIASGYKDFEYAKKAMTYGALDYCLKPFDHEEISAILRKYCIKRRESSAEAAPEWLRVSLALQSEDKSAPNTTFKKIIAYIDEHYREDISLKLISEKLNLNLSYVSQLFRKGGTETFLQYVTRRRIAFACELLKHTEISVQEIASMVGYLDYFHFAKIFKKATGQTATEYREMHTKK